MKYLSPLPLKKKYFVPIEKEINRILWEVFYKPVVIALSIPTKEIKNEQTPLYIKRPILNGHDLIAWAKSQGIENGLKPDDLHVTICHSRAPVEKDDILKQEGTIAISQTNGRAVTRLGDKGAIVLVFDSPALGTRWQNLIKTYGASWDFAGYIPHITLAYDPDHLIDESKIKPYQGILILGGEVHMKIAKSWREKINDLFTFSASALSKAIRSGDIVFDAGEFKGRFGAFASKELRQMGATYNKKTKSWVYAGALPPEISMSVAAAQAEFKAIQSRVAGAIAEIDTKRIEELSKAQAMYGIALDEMDDEFEKTVKSITIPPKLSAGMREVISKEWAQNLNLYIQKWTDQNIIALRQTVMQNTFIGGRSKSIVSDIQKNYGVSKAKAKFLARQETSLLMSKFRESRYKDIGVGKYRWSGSMDERERHDHKRLEGKVFSWDEPPITNLKTGQRNHPGEDFGCRCVAIPIIE